MFYHRFLSEGGGVSSGLWIILLEAGVALALLLGLVWWTLPKRKKGTQGPRDARKDSSQIR